MVLEADFIRKVALVCVVEMLVSYVVGVGGSCQNYNITAGCICINDTTGQLTDIKCIDARLTSLPPELPAANNMRIENNTIDVIDHVPYPDAIQKLFMPRNNIRLIIDRAFGNLSSLDTLNLEFNEITSFRKSTFDGLINLKTLSLRGNPIYSLKTSTFDGKILPQLQDLNLGNCHLYEFGDGAVDSLGNLAFLTLSHNNLRSMPLLGCAGHSLDKMFTFDVSYNEISRVEPSSCYLPVVNHINLNHNQIKNINASFLGHSIKYLHSLHLGHNEISHIDINAFNGSMNLTLLDVSSNKLTKLDEDTICWEHMQSVLVNDNPWYCVCDNVWLKTRDIVNKAEVRCATPLVVSNRTIESVQDTVFHGCDDVSKNHNHAVAITIGVLLTIVAVVVGCVVMYFMVGKRRSHSNIGSPASGLRTGSSIYRRMNTGNDVLFDYSTGTPTETSENATNEQKPVWKEMTAYEQNNNPFA